MSNPEPGLILISGGQTGADRAALDFALDNGLECGGWCPAGRKSEEGSIPEKYPVWEHSSPDYRVRTRKNVVESTGTVIFHFGPLSGGSLLTEKLCLSCNKPVLSLDGEYFSPLQAAEVLDEFREDFLVTVLNVAGQRASNEPRVYEFTYETLKKSLIVKKNS